MAALLRFSQHLQNANPAEFEIPFNVYNLYTTQTDSGVWCEILQTMHNSQRNSASNASQAFASMSKILSRTQVFYSLMVFFRVTRNEG